MHWDWSAVEACRQYLLLIASREITPELMRRGGASDMVQETMIVARRKIGEFRGQTDEELRAWLQRILTYVILNFKRNNTRSEAQSLDREVRDRRIDDITDPKPRASDPTTRVTEDERDRALLMAIERLPPKHRQVFAWRHEEGCSFEEIGRRLGISADGARKVWARAIAWLRDEMRPFES